ncbi:hypothetical protein F4808DRAFT_47488 [Astrocystis sublimbata]|nr:hypothetical protein F4808DRAFT_47488 [Astrocystis sublimbata]
MAGIAPSQMDATCNSHNALRNITGYAMGVSFTFKDSDNPPDMHYGVVSLKECCDKMNRPLYRIPGNTGCEIQFCLADPVTTTRSNGEQITGPPPDVDSCMRFVYEGDVPSDVSDKIAYAGSWFVPRFYDDELPASQVKEFVLASPAPQSWTAAVHGSGWDESPASSSATPTADPSPSSAHRVVGPLTLGDSIGLRVWATAAVAVMGLVAAL